MRQPEESINGPIFRFCVVPSGYSFGKRAPLISKKKRQRRTAASGKSGCFTIPQNYSYHFIHAALLYKTGLHFVQITAEGCQPGRRFSLPRHSTKNGIFDPLCLRIFREIQIAGEGAAPGRPGSSNRPHRNHLRPLPCVVAILPG